MDWNRLSSSLTEHWALLSPSSLAAAGIAWLGRRRGWKPRAWLWEQWKVREALWESQDKCAACEAKYETLIETNAGLERANAGLLEALTQLSNAGSLVKQAVEEGRLTPSTTPSTAPSNSPAPSTPSPPTRGGPP